MGLKEKVLVAWHNCGFVRVPRHHGKEPAVSEYRWPSECCWCDCDNPGLVYIHEEDEPCSCDCHLESDKDLPMIERAVRRSEDANRQADELGGRI